LDSNRLIPDSDRPVLAIGAAGVDIVGYLKGDLRPESSSPGQIRSSFGGVARNVAENLARLGQPVVLVTAVGDDDNGSRLLEVTSAAGVDVAPVLRTSQYPTCSYLAIIDAARVMRYAVEDMRSTNALTPQYIRAHSDLFKEASMLFIDANLPKDTLRTVMSLARKARLPVCADPTSVHLAEKLTPYLEHIYIMTPSSTEASFYCDPDQKITTRRQALEAAKHLVSHGVGIAIVTMGERGLCYADSETSGYIPAIRTEIIDPTGAGDALSAAVIFGLLNGILLADAVRLGVSAASLTLRYRGAVIPDLSLEKLYDQLVI